MIRTLARRLVTHAETAMPPAQRDWARGMASELEHIEEDAKALAFAFGAVWTGYRQGARLWSNWLRLGRWGAALWTAVLGLGLFYMSLWLGRIPEESRPAVPFSLLMVVLGCAYLGAGWALAKRRSGLFTGCVAVIGLLVASAALALSGSPETASPWAAYAAMLQGRPAAPEAFYAALLLEQFVLVALLAGAGAFFSRLERWKTFA